jgi:hypothetical protein
MAFCSAPVLILTATLTGTCTPPCYVSLDLSCFICDAASRYKLHANGIDSFNPNKASQICSEMFSPFSLTPMHNLVWLSASLISVQCSCEDSVISMKQIVLQ